MRHETKIGNRNACRSIVSAVVQKEKCTELNRRCYFCMDVFYTVDKLTFRSPTTCIKYR